MKKWKISVKIDDSSIENMELVDILEILDGYLNIYRTYFDELLNIVKND